MSTSASLSPDDAVARLADTRHLLVALDFDGTLSPLIDEPMDARMLPESREALDALIAVPQTSVALVSGRSLGDLRIIAEHRDDSPILLAGSHGAEHWVPGGTAGDGPTASERALRDRLRAAAEELVADIPNAWIEPKSYGFAVPSRVVAEADRADLHARMDALMAREAPTWRRREGHHIVEYAFRAEGKDAAVAWLRERTGASAVLFAGDDVTDEDALGALQPGDVGVHVGTGSTHARVRVEGIPQLAAMLVRLAHERAHRRE